MGKKRTRLGAGMEAYVVAFALQSHLAQSPDELSYVKNEALQLTDKLDDNGWWQATNVLGESGLIESRHFQVQESQPGARKKKSTFPPLLCQDDAMMMDHLHASAHVSRSTSPTHGASPVPELVSAPENCDHSFSPTQSAPVFGVSVPRMARQPRRQSRRERVPRERLISHQVDSGGCCDCSEGNKCIQ